MVVGQKEHQDSTQAVVAPMGSVQMGLAQKAQVDKDFAHRGSGHTDFVHMDFVRMRSFDLGSAPQHPID